MRKSFWASPDAERFPNRVYARVFYGNSTNLVNSAVGFVRALAAIIKRRPRVLVLGSVERATPWFIRARRLGLLGRARLVVTNQLHLDDEQLELVDRNIVYSQAWIDAQRPAVRSRAEFVPLPADGDFTTVSPRDGDYVFAGGGAGRDFATLIEALRGTGIPLRIVTFSPSTLGWTGTLPDDVQVEWRMPSAAFLERVAGARLVVVPLQDPQSDFGQTTVVQALSLGKPLVATRAPGIVDYVRDGGEGLLVEAGEVRGYRDAVLRLWGDVELRRRCGERALERAQLCSYAAFADRLADLVLSLADG